MFEYVKLKNFKSFGDVKFNLLDKSGNPKNMILVYGENGIGKSNLASSFFLLSESLRTMNVRDMLERILAENPEHIKDMDFARFLKMSFRDIEALVKENKTVRSSGNMYVEFGFRLKGKSGKYIIETNNTEIVHEHLEYTLLRNKGVYFDITPENKTINEKIFKDKALVSEIRSACNKFWGKHTFLSIIEHETDDKAENYFRNQISAQFKNVLGFFGTLSCKVKYGSRQERGIIGLPPDIFSDYSVGSIPANQVGKLYRAEQMLNAFFTTVYRDITKVYYIQQKEKRFIHYQLMLRKVIAGKEREIDFSLESTGTQSLLQLLPFLLVVVKGATVVIDEFDIGIHDILVRSLVMSLNRYITGQIIMTTHNTLLMESDVPKESIFVINEMDNGSKEIECITHYAPKIHRNTNMRDQYLLGKYNGIPEESSLDFNSLLDIIKK